MVNSFVNNFWDSEWDGTVGYDALVNRLKDGKKLYDDFTEFLRNRAKLEDDYGKNLIKLAQTAGNDEHGSTLRASWDSVKKETENVGNVHCDLSKQLTDLVERSREFREKQKLERKKIDDSMRKEQKEKKSCHENMLKVKRLYEQHCRESDSANEAYEAKSAYTPKEEDKLKRNVQKCKSAVEVADATYLTSVKQLEDLRKKYIFNMEDACRKFQAIEEDRIQFLRNEMWLYTNHGSTQVINIGEKYEVCRQILEKCSEAQDIQVFINTAHTGTIRPSPIEYVNYYHRK